MANLQTQLVNWTMTHCGVEHREYLGMHSIGRCPLKLYRQLIYGRQWTTEDRLMMEGGYLEEQRILLKLASLDGIDVSQLPLFPYDAFRARLNGLIAQRKGRLGPNEAFSDFGGRFQGHSDGSWDGHLLEIKSVIAARLPVRGGRIPNNHYWQIQAYMYYGQYRRAIVIYVARDTRQMRVLNVPYSEKVAELARIKAGEVLEAVERKQPPECMCGYCEEQGGRVAG